MSSPWQVGHFVPRRVASRGRRVASADDDVGAHPRVNTALIVIELEMRSRLIALLDVRAPTMPSSSLE